MYNKTDAIDDLYKMSQKKNSHRYIQLQLLNETVVNQF